VIANRACGQSPPMTRCPAVEYLAVAQMPHRWSRRIQGTLRRRSYRLPRAWHAVPAPGSAPAALCGFRYTREPHRTWMQTMIPKRCPQCQRLIDQAEAGAGAARRTTSTSPLWAVPSDNTEEHDGRGSRTGHPARISAHGAATEKPGAVGAT